MIDRTSNVAAVLTLLLSACLVDAARAQSHGTAGQEKAPVRDAGVVGERRGTSTLRGSASVALKLTVPR